MRFVLAVVLAATVFDGCGPKPKPVPPGPVHDGGPPPAPTPPSPPPPKPDASPGDAYVTACAVAAKLGCAEGKKSNCVPTLQHAAKERITPIDVDCAAVSSSVAEIRKCGAFFRCAP